MGITTSATAVAQTRVDSIANRIPGSYARQAAEVLEEWVTAAGTDDEATAAQAIVDAGYSLGQETGRWSTVDSILSQLLVETPAADRWTTSDGQRFTAAGRTYTQRTAPASEATSTTAAPTTAPVPTGDAIDRIASALERIATVMENDSE